MDNGTVLRRTVAGWSPDPIGTTATLNAVLAFDTRAGEGYSITGA